MGHVQPTAPALWAALPRTCQCLADLWILARCSPVATQCWLVHSTLHSMETLNRGTLGSPKLGALSPGQMPCLWSTHCSTITR
jgi:hypothetical protein